MLFLVDGFSCINFKSSYVTCKKLMNQFIEELRCKKYWARREFKTKYVARATTIKVTGSLHVGTKGLLYSVASHMP